MTLHERLKTIIKDAVPRGTTVAEVFLPFDAKTSAYRTTTPAAIFRIEEMEDRAFGMYRTNVRVDLLGKTTDVESMYKLICKAFSQQVNNGEWSISLAAGSIRETWDFDLNVDWGTMTLRGIVIEQ